MPMIYYYYLVVYLNSYNLFVYTLHKTFMIVILLAGDYIISGLRLGITLYNWLSRDRKFNMVFFLKKSV